MERIRIFRSIRWRLQLWQALLLLVVVSSFGTLLFVRTRQARLAEIDAELQGALFYLDATLRIFPEHELDPKIPREEPPPDDGGGAPRKKKRFDREELFEKLNLNERLMRREDAYFIIWRGRGDVLKASPQAPATKMPFVPEQKGKQHIVFWQTGPQREAALVGPSGAVLLVGMSIDKELSEFQRLGWQLLLLGGGLLLIGLAGSYVLTARMVRPITTMTEAAEKISASNLSHRIDTADLDSELAHLADILNAMFARLEGAFTQQARFTADASHELRTPLSVIHSQAELALARERPAEEYREALETCLRASKRMKGVVEGLLLLARADARKLTLKPQRVDLTELVMETMELLRPLAEPNDVVLKVAMNQVDIRGDADQLARVLTNLITNAIQYNRRGGSVKVTLVRRNNEALLTVADTGCGIPLEDQPHIFERFFRVDKSRSRQIGGSGLGLAICRSLIEAHGGTLGFTSIPDQGTTFTITLPLPEENIYRVGNINKDSSSDGL